MKIYVETRTQEQAAQELAHIADFLGCDPQEIGEARETTIIHSKLGVKDENGVYIYRRNGEKKTSQRTKKRERRFARVIAAFQ